MDEHDLDGDAFDGLSAPERRMREFLRLRLAGLAEGESLPEEYWSTRMQEYRQRLASLSNDLAALGDSAGDSGTPSV
jgi:hypothetical protein